MNIQIMRAFVRLRQMLATNANLERKLNELEKKYDAQFKVVFDAICQLMAPPQILFRVQWTIKMGSQFLYQLTVPLFIAS